MAWVRLDDQYPEHPKVTAAGHLAGWLDVCAMAYCNRQLTDGFVAKSMVPRLSTVPAPMKRAAELVAAGRWTEVDGGFQIHDYLAYQKTADQIRRDRDGAAERQAKFRSRHAGSNAVTNGPVTPSPIPIPKEQTLSVVPDEPVATAGKRKTPTPDGMEVTPVMTEWAVANGIRTDVLADQTERFLDHHRSKGSKFIDWTAAWRTWMKNATRFTPEILATTTTVDRGPNTKAY